MRKERLRAPEHLSVAAGTASADVGTRCQTKAGRSGCLAPKVGNGTSLPIRISNAGPEKAVGRARRARRRHVSPGVDWDRRVHLPAPAQAHGELPLPAFPIKHGCSTCPPNLPDIPRRPRKGGQLRKARASAPEHLSARPAARAPNPLHKESGPTVGHLGQGG